jgi:hypothetical protein
MNTDLSLIRRLALLVGCGAALALPAPRALAADDPVQADAFPSYESYIKISGQTAWTTGDDASLASHTGQPAAGSYGIEDLMFSKDLTDATTLTVKGKALSGSDDYLASVNIDTTNVGTIDAGYKRFRTFYDGVGGFFPMSDTFQVLSPESLHVDRGSFWATATLAKPGAPVFTVSFHDDTRTGMVDSTEWGPVINPNAVITRGVLVGTALPTNTPYVSPNVQQLDEHHKTLEGSMVAKVGNTTETLKATFDWVNNADERDYVKYPNSTVIADPTVMVQDDQELLNATTFRLLSQTETKINDIFSVDLGLTFAHVTSTDGGTWITPTYSTTAKAVYTAETAADIYGGASSYDYVGNAFLKYTPSKDWNIDYGFRYESNEVGSSGGFQNTSLTSTAPTTAATYLVTKEELTYSNYTDKAATPELTLEYLGLSSLCLYGTFDDRIDHGDQHWINPYAASTVTGTGAAVLAGAPLGSVFFQEADQDYTDVKVGANWNASSMLTIRGEVYRKDHQNRFVGANDIIGTGSYGGLFVTGYTFTGFKITVIFKPNSQLSFSTRYQPQEGVMSVTAATVNGGSGNEVTSGKAVGQEISETVNWTPSGQIYLQGSVNLVYNYIQTAYPVVVVSATTDIATPIQNANDNYVYGNALVGFVIDKNTDAQLQGTMVKADNYNPQIAPGGQPYGSSFNQESVTVGLKHKFNDRLIGEGKVGYLELTDPTTGGFTNYRGPLAYISVTYSL